ncbi:MAG: protelomerase family protein [Cyanobacteria bacterium J06635_11]
MPTVKALPVERFQQYVTGLRMPKKLEAHIPLFLAKLSQAKATKTIEQLCRDEKAWFEEQYTNPNTRAAHMTRYRKAISTMVAYERIELTDDNSYLQQTQDGIFLEHLAMKLMNYSSEFHQARQAPTQAKTKAQRRNRIAFEPWPLVEAAKIALASHDYRGIAAGIIAVTGRRPTEILKSGDFEIVSKYKVAFTGQLKARGKSEGYAIYSLVEANLLLDAFTALRRDIDVKALSKLENTKVDSQRNSTLNRAIGRIFEGILQPPVGEKFLSAKNLRAAYTNVAYHFFSTPSESISSFAEDYLGHQGASSASNYEDYYCVDSQGQPLAIGLKRNELNQPAAAPLADKRATVHIDGLLKERFDAFGSGTHKDKIAQLLDMADRYEALERRLYNAEQRLDLARKHIDLLKEKQAEQAAEVKPKPKRSHKPTPDDWTKATNAELAGDRTPGSADEKIRRSIEAFQEHNAGLPEVEQWAITPTVIQKLSGSNSTRVQDYLARHPETVEMLEQYNAGFGYHQNRGKGNPRDSVKWSATYGDYDW